MLNFEARLTKLDLNVPGLKIRLFAKKGKMKYPSLLVLRRVKV